MRVFRLIDGRVREERHPSVFMDVRRYVVETAEVRPEERRSVYATLVRVTWWVHELYDGDFVCALWLPRDVEPSNAHLEQVNALLGQVSQTRERT